VIEPGKSRGRRRATVMMLSGRRKTLVAVTSEFYLEMTRE